LCAAEASLSSKTGFATYIRRLPLISVSLFGGNSLATSQLFVSSFTPSFNASPRASLLCAAQVAFGSIRTKALASPEPCRGQLGISHTDVAAFKGVNFGQANSAARNNHKSVPNRFERFIFGAFTNG